MYCHIAKVLHGCTPHAACLKLAVTDIAPRVLSGGNTCCVGERISTCGNLLLSVFLLLDPVAIAYQLLGVRRKGVAVGTASFFSGDGGSVGRRIEIASLGSR